MTPAAALLLAPAVLLAVLPAPVRCSVDEFQCACGLDALRHVRFVRAALDAGDGATAARAAAAYGATVRRMLSVAYDARPEPTARWLWLMDLYADGARRGHDEADAAARERRLRDDLDRVRGELDRYVRLCEAGGLTGLAGRWSGAGFDRYLLERVTAARATGAGQPDAADETRFEPDRLYLDHAAGGTAVADAVMPRDAGVDWADAAAWLAGLYRAARRGGASGTPQLVLYQKRFASAVAATAMAHALVHVTHFQEYRQAYGGPAGESGPARGGADDDDDGSSSSSYVGEYERAWMSVGGLLDKFRAYLGGVRAVEGHFKALADVAANPVRDPDAIRAVKRAIRARIADVGDGLFGPARTAAVPATVTAAAAAGGSSESSSALIDLIALVDHNIGAAERYLAAVQAALPGVDFRVVNEFMRSTHVWLT